VFQALLQKIKLFFICVRKNFNGSIPTGDLFFLYYVVDIFIADAIEIKITLGVSFKRQTPKPFKNLNSSLL